MSRGQDIVLPPWCPFCGQRIGRPREPEQRKLGEFAVGRCGCGAVYACDATGHNVGAAMIEAMVYACNDDWDLAWSLMPEDDYLTGRIERYDEITHQVVETGNLDGRAVRGVLYFVRLHKDIAEVTDRLATRKAQQATTTVKVEPARDPKRKRRRATKEQVADLVAANDLDGLVDLLFDDKRTLRFLQRLLYTVDDDLRWRTALLIGQACARYSTRHPGPVSDLLHRLFAAADDSAASSWGTIETIGAVVAHRPDIFGAFTRHLLRYMNDQTRQPLIIWALGSIAANRPDLIRNLPFFHFFRFLDHPEPELRGLTLRLLTRIKASEARSAIGKLIDDPAPFHWYEADGVHRSTVGAAARQALAVIGDAPPATLAPFPGPAPATPG